jgi:hypothetical protein
MIPGHVQDMPKQKAIYIVSRTVDAIGSSPANNANVPDDNPNA